MTDPVTLTPADRSAMLREIADAAESAYGPGACLVVALRERERDAAEAAPTPAQGEPQSLIDWFRRIADPSCVRLSYGSWRLSRDGISPALANAVVAELETSAAEKAQAERERDEARRQRDAADWNGGAQRTLSAARLEAAAAVRRAEAAESALAAMTKERDDARSAGDAWRRSLDRAVEIAQQTGRELNETKSALAAMRAERDAAVAQRDALTKQIAAAHATIGLAVDDLYDMAHAPAETKEPGQ